MPISGTLITRVTGDRCPTGAEGSSIDAPHPNRRDQRDYAEQEQRTREAASSGELLHCPKLCERVPSPESLYLRKIERRVTVTRKRLENVCSARFGDTETGRAAFHVARGPCAPRGDLARFSAPFSGPSIPPRSFLSIGCILSPCNSLRS